MNRLIIAYHFHHLFTPSRAEFRANSSGDYLSQLLWLCIVIVTYTRKISENVLN